jgi:hypothetical protein
LAIATSALIVFVAGTARAQDEPLVPERPRPSRLDESEPRGQFAVTYQNQKTQDLVTSHGTLKQQPIRAQALDFAVTYRIKDRWTVNAGLPYIGREAATPSHNPLNVIPPQLDSEFVDDGHFHPAFQDLRFGASFLVTSEPILIEPYVEYAIPASDYPFFAASAIGRHLQTLEIGTTLAYRPPFLKWYFSLQTGYVMADKVLGYDINAMRSTADAVYFLSPRLALNVFLHSRNGKGFDAPIAPNFTTEIWYRHDQITRHNYTNLGVGFDWSLSERNALNVSLLKMTHAEDVFKLRRAVSVTWSRPFSF